MCTSTKWFDLNMAPTFECIECEESFSNFRNLSRHLKIHDPNSQFCCQLCTFTTKRKDSLKRHSTKYHMANNDATNCHNPQSVIPSMRLDLISAAELSNTEQKTASSQNITEFDKRLQLPNNFIYAGSTQSGKTTLLMKTLENAAKYYRPVPTRVYFLHNCFQENYEKLKKNLHSQGVQIEFIKKPTVSEKDLEYMADSNDGQTLIIIDDNSISAASSKEVAQVFTVARHKNCSIVLLLHFIFGPWPSSRIISANTSYFFLLKSPRMTQQVSTLGSQLGKQNQLISAYTEASREPYGYVLLDLCTNTPDNFRIRTDILAVGEQQNELSQVENSMSKYGLKTTEVPLQVKSQKNVTPLLEKKSSAHLKKITSKRTTRKQKKKRSRNVPTVNFLNSSIVPFANRYKRFI